uniref:ferredoxin--NADP(+) reductase n=1 Tax=Polytomella parva TaxID=51329 RepID=A0A7S0YNY5_9CHLO|nr:ferredoxin-NADP reductase chloroplastic (FNRL) [Polytomella parva]|mmetsp:Transcript_3537/g.6057  ORF Transcript_3537/g.6057 Transcript_3537/m.6057 type:complete len:349 (+) Transcript_3537:32-1078(+)|eukprot:CAMPEP_0175052490 /NCGR_PEP_ID=MMETSP0052_2-20121109/8388_1 /TAXON_ID=51329 ORGANISM="Polytomella parva, Strain SAG 63-3" /NCGR_SAMPLE_ID=MMETSP0052_2 /ASSEMBLY_ACC=CAM_ASM_000194 /LENGTH=348 /DNA_ID=CAMNT_0016316899 /DNA_START=32 /DNA_END=1078 /DNA_ORIENTATION=+
MQIAHIAPISLQQRVNRQVRVTLRCNAQVKPAPAPYVLTDVSKKEVSKGLEGGKLPLNTFSTKKPYTAKVLSVEKIVGPKATGETFHVVLDTQGVKYHEGQSLGVIPPGTKKNSKGKEVPHGTRLYSIASSRYGDNFEGNTTTLCIRRAVYTDPKTGKEDPAKQGICSNYLTKAAPGTEVTVTGPTGKVLLLPEDASQTVICVATGTGIAPFRSFWRRCFVENVPGYKFNGKLWLFMGVANSDSKLYDEELQALKKAYPEQFRLDYALSREQKNSKGQKMYIQDKVEEYADEVFSLLDNGAHIYFCGLKGMMPGIQGMLERVAKSKGLVYADWVEKLKHKSQWHVEVY